MKEFQLIPEQASTMAPRVDNLLFFFVAVSVFFTVLIVGQLLYFSLRYKKREGDDSHVGEESMSHEAAKKLEVAWIVIPLAITMVMFFWGAKLFAAMVTPPEDAMQFYVTGKRWMWKIQHPTGQREINELHVPLGRAVKLTMTSEDVLHSFYVPAFRVKQDVVPGQYTTMWFEASKVGEYYLFCAEYCGTKHSGMIGKVVVLEPTDYEAWLSGGGGAASAGSSAAQGAKLFSDLACKTCHTSGPDARGPELAGAFGSEVALADGTSVKFDEGYARESILAPTAKVRSGFAPVMPSFAGQVKEQDLLSLIDYIASLKAAPGAANALPAAAPATQPAAAQQPAAAASANQPQPSQTP